MDPIATPLLVLVLGKLADKVIVEACEEYLKDKLKKFFSWFEKLGERDKIELAYRDAMERAYRACLEMLLLNIKSLGYSDEELKQYQSSLKAFIKDKKVAGELLKAVREPGRDDLPSPGVLRERWKAVDGKELPSDIIWNGVASAFRRQATKQSILSDELRELLNAQNLQQLKDLIERQGGVKVQVRRDKYSQRMRTKFSPVDLANLMPAYADDPGRMVIRDVFVAQNVREDPPPIEIPKDLADRLRIDGRHETDEDPYGNLDEQQLERLRTAYASQSPQPVLDVIASPDNRLLVLTGDPGSGKSTLMRYLLTGLIEPPVDPQSGEPLPWTLSFKDAFPLLIELRDFYALRRDNECDSFLEYVAFMGKTDQWFLDDHAVHGYLEDGPSLVMFDGLDEIFDTADRERVMSEIAGFAQRYPRAKIIVTSRPVGYKEQVLRNAGFKHFGIQDLTREQIETFIRGWFALTFPQQPRQAEQRIERVLDSVRRSRPIRLLAGNPMLLTIMALLAREEELPRERAKFYEKAVEVLCHHWDANRNLQLPGEQYLTADDKKDLLRRIAIGMQEGEGGIKGNFILKNDLEREIQGYLTDERWQSDPAEARKAARRMIRQLRERNYILCLRGPRLYGFVHRTFLEYLTAAEYVQRFDRQPQRMTFDELLGLFDEHCRDDEWREVLRLICGQIDEQFVGRIIEHLAARAKEDGKSRPVPEIPLAVYCLGEVRNANRLQSAGKALAEQIVDVYATFDVSPLLDFDAYRNALECLGDLRSATEAIGPAWPGLPDLSDSSHKVCESAQGNSVAAGEWPHFASITGAERDLILDLTSSAKASIRGGALEALARHWPEERTRELLAERAAEDEDGSARSSALEALAQHWPEEQTRALLARRAAEDEDRFVRRSTLAALAQHWPEEQTRGLLARRASIDGIAASLTGGQHSRFGKVVFTKDLDGMAPYLNPAEPVSREHIEGAAEKASVPADEIDEVVRSLSAHLGWDITKGAAG